MKTSILGLCTMLFLAGCSNVYDVSYDYDDSYVISELTTYDFLPLTKKNRQRSDSINFERIQRAITADLATKGLERSSAEPEFTIEIVFGSKGRTRSRHGGRYRYKEGYLSVDFIDPRNDRLIWHGTAQAVLDEDYTPEQSERLINEVVGQIMQNYPPQGER